MNATESVDVLLVGGGVASVRCARTLRRHGFAGSILIVGDEPSAPYNRPPLSKELLREDLPDELVLAEAEAWYERRAIGLRRGTRVVALDPDARLASLDDGASVRFGQCLLATGAEPRRPPIPGIERARTLRTIGDAHAIRASAVPGARFAIVGGGFIGVEVASSLAARGVAATVVELAGAPWGGSLGSELGAWAMDRLGEAGVEVHTDATATEIAHDGIRLGAGHVPADEVLVAVGVTPRDELARDAGLAVDDGIVADARQATSGPAIFAAGDVARIEGRRIEHWHAAREGGERAALAMLGADVPPQRAPWVFSEVAGHQLDVVGWAPTWDEVLPLAVDGGPVLAYLRDGVVAQIAIVDGAIPVDEARASVEGAPRPDELSWPAG